MKLYEKDFDEEEIKEKNKVKDKVEVDKKYRWDGGYKGI